MRKNFNVKVVASLISSSMILVPRTATTDHWAKIVTQLQAESISGQNISIVNVNLQQSQ